ncbi:hypothetical protein ACU8KH_03636 [Lachancea thermotolerans]
MLYKVSIDQHTLDYAGNNTIDDTDLWLNRLDRHGVATRLWVAQDMLDIESAEVVADSKGTNFFSWISRRYTVVGSRITNAMGVL